MCSRASSYVVRFCYDLFVYLYGGVMYGDYKICIKSCGCCKSVLSFGKMYGVSRNRYFILKYSVKCLWCEFVWNRSASTDIVLIEGSGIVLLCMWVR